MVSQNIGSNWMDSDFLLFKCFYLGFSTGFFKILKFPQKYINITHGDLIVKINGFNAGVTSLIPVDISWTLNYYP